MKKLDLCCLDQAFTRYLKYLMGDETQFWRKEWDSNPRYPYGYNGFRDRPIQPLSHLSG